MNQLTLRPAASGESILTTASESASEDDSFKPVPEKSDFISGVRHNIRRFGSLSGSSIPPSTERFFSRRKRHERDLSNHEKPLPKPPFSPLLQGSSTNASSPLHTPRAFAQMSRPATSASRSSTMDSTSTPPSQMSGGSKPGYDGNTSQSSIASSNRQEGDDEPRDIMTPRSNGPPSAAPSPAQPRSAGGTPVGTSGGSTHLSGLMCNVHRTTGREPRPLVGATTTILGDKLYVFGGRILSRTRPALTADLYELDLIRRHWMKLETTGDIPPPRYFHSMCPLGDTKLVCYGGMSPAPNQGQPIPVAGSQNGQDAQPEVVVMSDIYVYDTPSRTWSYIATQDTPQGRYAHCATILPSAATFSSMIAPLSALQHNPSGSHPNQGSLGVSIDGAGGAEMVVVGGQDSANHYIQQISVFNLRSLKWVSTEQLEKSCGAYRSVVAPLSSSVCGRIGKTLPARPDNGGISQDAKEPAASMLIYSNYNFLDVKLELQVRSPDGTLTEKSMHGTFSPPGLRFPNGGVIDTNFVVSGTYLTSSKQEYALWALDLKTLTWSRIDAGGSVFSQGSWNRGILWNRRNTFVILGNRKRSLVEDYNHRRINFSNVCMVELEAFGLYDNPRKVAPMSGYVSASSPFLAPSLNVNAKAGWAAGGRSLSKAAEDLGQAALALREMSDMDILCVGGERIPVNSRIIAKRWGPYFVQLLREGAATQDGNDAATLRPENVFRHNQSRNSSITITPSVGAHSSNLSTSSTLNNPNPTSVSSSQGADPSALALPPDPASLPPTSRPRTLYLPHTHLTLQSLLYYLYTSSLPPSNSSLCTPQILCSLLQLARPYKIDGLLEAVVERLHSVLDSRNAAAVFNASAMAAGSGRSTSTASDVGENWLSNTAEANGNGAPQLQLGSLGGDLTSRTQQALRINTSVGGQALGRKEDDEMSQGSSAASDFSGSDISGSRGTSEVGRNEGDVWRGDVSAVIGLQKRGLRGLMEGRRLRERGGSIGPQQQRVGLGIANVFEGEGGVVNGHVYPFEALDLESRSGGQRRDPYSGTWGPLVRANIKQGGSDPTKSRAHTSSPIYAEIRRVKHKYTVVPKIPHREDIWEIPDQGQTSAGWLEIYILQLATLPMAIRTLQVRPISVPSTSAVDFGAEIANIDLENLSEEDFAQIRDILYRSHVVVLKDQAGLSPKAQYEFTKRFDLDANNYGHGKTLDVKRSILHPDLKTIPHQPQVQVIGNGFYEEYEGLRSITLKHPHHRTFHKTIIPQEDDLKATRFYRWHMDAALYALNAPKVTTLLAVRVPKGRSQTLRYDDGSNEELVVPLGTTAFVSGQKMYDLLSEEDKEFVRGAKVEYAPHPYVWMSPAKSRPDGLGMVSEGLELPLSDLPPFNEADIKILPMCYKNPVTGNLALQIHPSAIKAIHLPNGEVMTDLKEVRDLVHRFQRPAISPQYVYPHDWDEGDLVLFNNQGVLHTVVGAFSPEEKRLFRQCNLASSEGVMGPDGKLY
ncbi:hypothetical protein B7494_g491 [Chlorociboria aeruginascens]|nr:hypothetical protein B7494_g491 [Chlorociboria aeruginascens]